jgi:hypothetical protein
MRLCVAPTSGVYVRSAKHFLVIDPRAVPYMAF